MGKSNARYLKSIMLDIFKKLMLGFKKSNARYLKKIMLDIFKKVMVGFSKN
jgi:hypothetical protein